MSVELLGDASRAGIVGRGHRFPIAIFSFERFEETASRLSGFDDVVAFVDIFIDLESVLLGRGRNELPNSGGLGGRISPRIERAFNASEVNDIFGNSIFLQDRNYLGEIPVGAFKQQESIAVGVGNGSELAV